MKERYSVAWWGVTALFSVGTGGCLGYLLSLHALLWAGLSLLVVFCVWSVGERYQSSLIVRVNAVNAPELAVYHDGTFCGRISDGQVAVMQQHIFLDARTGLAQVVNLLLTGANILKAVLAIIPKMLFWLVVALVVFLPQDAVNLLTSLRQSSSQEVIDTLRLVGPLLFTVCVLSMVVMISLGWQPGFRNCWQAALDNVLRRHFALGNTGDITLRPVDDMWIFSEVRG